jgi:predicted small secreted protein
MKDKIMSFLALNGPSVGIVILLVVALVMLTGCNTVAGIGTDITKSAEWSRDKMSGNKDSQSQGGTK